MSRVCGGSSVWVLSFEQLRSQHNFTVVLRNVFIIGVASTCWSQRLVNVCCSSVNEILVACRYDSVVVTTKRYLNDYAWSWSRWTMRWWGHRCFNSKKSLLHDEVYKSPMSVTSARIVLRIQSFLYPLILFSFSLMKTIGCMNPSFINSTDYSEISSTWGG